MPIASKRSSNHQTIRRLQPKQSRDPQDDDGYDDYVYYPYYPQATSENGYPYADEPDQYEERPVQRYTNPSANSLVQQPRGWVEQRLVSWLHRIEPHDEDIGVFSLSLTLSREDTCRQPCLLRVFFRYSMRYGNEWGFIFQRLCRPTWFFSLLMPLNWWSKRSLAVLWTQNGVESVCLPIVTVVENRVSNSIGFHRSLSWFLPRTPIQASWKVNWLCTTEGYSVRSKAVLRVFICRKVCLMSFEHKIRPVAQLV